MDDITDIRHLYDNAWADEDGRLQRHQLERDVTLRFLDRYLPADGRILEIGAATGYYTLQMARLGYQVHAVDLAPELMNRLQERVAEAGFQDRVTCEAGDARDLSALPRAAFDAALIMGPLYHLVLPEDRLLALRQAHARLKPGGVVFSAFISRFGILGDLIKNQTAYIHEQEAVAYFMERGRDTDEILERIRSTTKKHVFRGYFATVDEIEPLHAEAGFETLALAGVEPAISADDESYNRLEGETRRLWLDLLSNVATERSMIASSRHLLYVGKKAKGVGAP